MTDERKDESDEAAKGPSGGERLAEARRLKQISLPDIARELHLDEAKVQALEENRFDVLGAPVFAKGHMRKYAELVGVSMDDVLADYYRMNRASGAPPVVGPPREKVRDFSLSPWVFAVPVLIVLGVIAWLWLGRVSTTPEMLVEPQSAPESSVEAAPPPVIESTAAVADAGTSEEEAEPEPELAETPAVQENPPQEAVASPVAAEGETVLTLDFTGDCWTEVTDADGSRLFFDLGSAGRQVNLTGRAPLRVLLGNSNNVSVSVDGSPYRIAASDLRGDTARLTIN